MGTRLVIAVVLSLLAVPPAAAQEEDEQTRDWEQRDRLYYERYLEDERESEQETGPAGPDFEAFLSRAQELVKDRDYRSASSEHYRLQTDDSRLDAEAALELLETFRTFFDDFWSSRLELRPDEQVSRVFLFRSFHKYNQLLGSDFSRSEIRPKGHYLHAFNIIAAHTGADIAQQLPDAVVHEAAHQLVGRRIYAVGAPASLWVNEGLASYFGYTYRDKHGRFQPGLVGGKSTRLIRDSARGQSREGVVRLRQFRRVLRSAGPGDPGLIDYLIHMQDPRQFYGGDAELHYSGSWMLVHFLLHGEGGRYDEAFVRYLEAESRGRGGPEALYREIGVGSAELETAFLDHVRSVKTR